MFKLLKLRTKIFEILKILFPTTTALIFNPQFGLPIVWQKMAERN